MVTTPVMFLGGPLDHAVRQVAAHPAGSSRPDREIVFALDDDYGKVIYRLHSVVADPKYHWWCYVLDGYAPPTRHLIDAAPSNTLQGAS